jgi:hypothetical protein
MAEGGLLGISSEDWGWEGWGGGAVVDWWVVLRHEIIHRAYRILRME